MKTFVGIDCGLSGAIAFIDETGQVIIKDTPVISEKSKKGYRKKYDIKNMIEIFNNIIPSKTFCVLEKAQAMPGQGVVSMFSIGYGFGIWETILTFLCIPYEIVHPKKWQKEFSISGDTKIQAYQVASKLFPGSVFKTERGKIKTGFVDAVLIAEYGRRKFLGKKEV